MKISLDAVNHSVYSYFFIWIFGLLRLVESRFFRHRPYAIISLAPTRTWYNYV